ncbi:putative odorant receptor 71a [Sitodiplosis mosellana]|uniref:putative odorant receptor 71a n=1 Tax=Sitodiplosis mosellana TaxID=263140 RepID=UPI002444A877|nr:putative odorant receptor 71a [Sitodiplosis mosellana]
MPLPLSTATLRKSESISRHQYGAIGTRLEDPKSAAIYANVNEKVETWTEITYFALVKLSIPGIMLPKFIISFYLYFSTTLGEDTFSLPFPMWLPFDWKTPHGYLIAYAIQYAAVYYVFHAAVCHLGFLIGSCEILMAFAMDLKQEFNTLVEKPDENQTELKKKLSKFIQFHCSAKQLVEELADLYKFIFSFGVLWSISNICSTLLLVEMEMVNNAGNLLGLIQPLTLMFWSFVLVLLYCDFGERVCGEFDAVHNTIEECDWYLFPIEIQKMLLTIMMADQPVVLKGFANVVITRETSKKIANGGYSYFNILRQFVK